MEPNQAFNEIPVRPPVVESTTPIEIKSTLQPLNRVRKALHLRVHPGPRTTITASDKVHVTVPVPGGIDSVPG